MISNILAQDTSFKFYSSGLIYLQDDSDDDIAEIEESDVTGSQSFNEMPLPKVKTIQTCNSRNHATTMFDARLFLTFTRKKMGENNQYWATLAKVNSRENF